jgi:hypothetical protein
MSSSKRRRIQHVNVWPNIFIHCFLHDVSKVKGNIIAKQKNIYTQVTWSKLEGGGHRTQIWIHVKWQVLPLEGNKSHTTQLAKHHNHSSMPNNTIMIQFNPSLNITTGFLCSLTGCHKADILSNSHM